MRGQAELLEDDLRVLDQARERISSMQRATERAAALTDEPAVVHSSARDDPDLVDMHDVVNAVHDMMGQLVGDAIDIVLHLDAVVRGACRRPPYGAGHPQPW